MYKRKSTPIIPIEKPPPNNIEYCEYDLMWRKKSTKVHKRWEGDAVGRVKINGNNITLEITTDCRKLGSVKLESIDIEAGSILSSNGLEFEVGETKNMTTVSSQPQENQMLSGLNTPFKTNDSFPPSKKIKKTPPSLSNGFSTPFKVPMDYKVNTITKDINSGPVKIEDAIDPELLKNLRPHQIEGVDFIVNSVLGHRHSYGEGCILADEMGLGKTLTSIASVHTLINNKFIKNALIVCPVTLIANWKAEFNKWLPPFKYSNFGVLSIDQNGMGNNSIRDPALSFFNDKQFKTFQVMIIGYERVRLILPQLTSQSKQFDLVICDEGHRLKTTNSKTTEALEQICTSKRVILSGTPIQNDLTEFWALANFTNPGIFGSESKFNKKFTSKIDSSQQNEEKNEALSDLIEICDDFLLRRDCTTLSKYIPVKKSEFVVFCRPTIGQATKYSELTATAYENILGASSISIDQGSCLQAISELRKVANGDKDDHGGKLKFLSHLLKSLKKISPEEKIVIVSGSTRILDLCQDICISENISWLRLDGSTPQEKRQSSVNLFNKKPPATAGAFLLSSRSGGMGLNLIGGSRLVLLDCDWNPAIDAQVMGRIHRDGQKKPCYIYRLLTTGTIDEKIFQRQLSKIDLSQHILASVSESKPTFSREGLKDIFNFSVPLKCDTLVQCVELNGYKESSYKDEVLSHAISISIDPQVSCVLTKE